MSTYFKHILKAKFCPHHLAEARKWTDTSSSPATLPVQDWTHSKMLFTRSTMHFPAVQTKRGKKQVPDSEQTKGNHASYNLQVSNCQKLSSYSNWIKEKTHSQLSRETASASGNPWTKFHWKMRWCSGEYFYLVCIHVLLPRHLWLDTTKNGIPGRIGT